MTDSDSEVDAEGADSDTMALDVTAFGHVPKAIWQPGLAQCPSSFPHHLYQKSVNCVKSQANY
jgi:hypothetical protein